MMCMRRRAICGVWFVFSVIGFFSMGVTDLFVFLNTSPPIGMDKLETKVIFVATSLDVLASNIPDALSVFVYFKMWTHFHSKIHADSTPNLNVEEAELERHGGIWVGQLDIPSSGQESESGGEQEHSNQELSSDNGHSVNAVMRALLWHLRLAIADVLYVLLAAIGHSRVSVMVGYCFQVVCYFWVPLLVIVKGFRQIDQGLRLVV